MTSPHGLAAGTGRSGAALIVTVFGALFAVPLLTINRATYVPTTSATKVGVTALELESTAALPAGLVVRLQAKVSGS